MAETHTATMLDVRADQANWARKSTTWETATETTDTRL
jgi:hypothetical protein